jgi:mono/diheme cytochrome c family protein
LTEIPEHLLRRSRERRAALGLGGDGEGGGDGEPGGALAARSDAPPAKAATGTTGAAAKAGGAAATPAIIDEPVDLAPKPVYVAPTGPHKLRVPIWVMPVLVAIPLWAFFFPAAFSNHKKAAVVDPITIGSGVYHSSCSTCHGSNGEGGVGPALHGGLAAITFPNVADHIDWVKNGSTGLAKNAPYGDPNRAGGQHLASKNDMPGFASSLTATQIQDVVAYERTKL